MKISTLIRELTELQETYGDLEVSVQHPEFLSCDMVSSVAVRESNKVKSGLWGDDPRLGERFVLISE